MHGHTDAVSRVAFSRDRRTLASVSNDGTIRLWDARSRKQLGGPLIGHTRAVSSVAFSPGGRTLASVSEGTIRLWDVRSGKQLGAAIVPDVRLRVAGLAVSLDAVSDVAFSPDGRRLVSAGSDGTIRWWDVRTQTQITPLTRQTSAVGPVAFSPDASSLVSVSRDTTIRLWDVRTGKQLGAAIRLPDVLPRRPLGPRVRNRMLRQSLNAVGHLAFSPDGRMLVSVNRDATIPLWDVRTRRQLGRSLIGHTGPVFSVAFSPTGAPWHPPATTRRFGCGTCAPTGSSRG